MMGVLAMAVWGTLQTCGAAPVEPAAAFADGAERPTVQPTAPAPDEEAPDEVPADPDAAPTLIAVITDVRTRERGAPAASATQITRDEVEHRAIAAVVSAAVPALTDCYSGEHEASEAIVSWSVGANGYTEATTIDPGALSMVTRQCISDLLIRFIVPELAEASTQRRWQVTASLHWTP